MNQRSADSRALPGDPQFFSRTGPHSLATVVDVAEGQASPRQIMLRGIAPLQTAGPDEVSFLDNKRYLGLLSETQAGAVIVHPDFAARVPETSVAIVTEQPYLGWAKVAALFHPPPPPVPGVHPSAVVAADATIDPSAEIGPLAVIGNRVKIAARCRIASLAVIGDGVEMAEDCRIGSHASVSHAVLGRRVNICPGARVGQEGFGFAIAESGFLTVPQLGRVVLEDDVEIGANSTIDRGSAQDTVIGVGSRIDNLVQIGHNVKLGRCCIVVGQAGISGSTELEDFVVVAAQAGLTGHLRIGVRARIGAQAGVMADIEPGMDVIGSPCQPVRSFWREIATVRRLVKARRTGGEKTGGEKTTD